MTVPLDQAERIVAAGGVVLYPTLTLWGLGGDARHTGVIERVQQLKGRGAQSPFLVLVRDLGAVAGLAPVLPAAAVRLATAFWPGELTLLVPAGDAVPRALVGQDGLVGVRLPTHPAPEALVRGGAWLVSTSANLTGEPPPVTLGDVPDSIRRGVDAVVDVPPPPVGAPSTVVAVTADGRVRLVREGAVPQSAIWSLLEESGHG